MSPKSGLTKPFIVPVFIPHAGCPHRCVFCNQHSTTGQAAVLPTVRAVRETIDRFLSFRRDHARRTEIAFYGGNFLGLPREQVQLLLTTATGYVTRGHVQGLRFSTRPDTIDPIRLAWIAPHPVTTIELGVQSMHDPVLAMSSRGHTAADVQSAVALLKERPYALGVQIMVGLPGDSPQTAMTTARRLAVLAPNFARIYPTLVLKGSRLARWHAQGRYHPAPLADTVALVGALYQIFHRHNVPVIRMGLQPTGNLSPGAEVLAGPFHPAFGALVRSALWLDAICRHMERERMRKCDLRIDVHPRFLSQVKGEKDANILSLMERFGLPGIEVRSDRSLAQGMVMINGKPCAML